MDPHFRLAIEPTENGTKNVVMSISGEFYTNTEMAAFMKDYGDELIRHADSLDRSTREKAEESAPVAV